MSIVMLTFVSVSELQYISEGIRVTGDELELR